MAALLLAASAPAQNFSARGYFEMRGLAFPQDTPGDSGHLVGEALLRWEASQLLSAGWKVFGAVEARMDTHRQTERKLRLDWQDRTLERPALSLRRFSASYRRGGLTAEFGKQLIRWGKTDILQPTDRFAPRDYLEVVRTDFLGVPAARAAYEVGGETLEFVYTPRFTPSRVPLINQRWATLPPQAAGFRLLDAGSRIPGGGQFGVRWNHIGRGFEASASFFEGFQHLPVLEARLTPSAVALTRIYPRLRCWGAAAAAPLGWFTLKGEAALFLATRRQADDFLLYVVQLERQQGEWTFVGGWAGEWVSARRNPLFFAPDRGIARTFMGRAAYNIGVDGSFAVETAIRRNGDGAYVKAEYSQAWGSHWRLTAGFVLLQGRMDDFLGQYRRNSHATLTLRYSF